MASCDSEVNKVQQGPLHGSHQLFLLLPHWLPSAQIKSEAQPTPQGIQYYSENTGVLLARVRSLFWEHIPLLQSDTEWIRPMSDTGLVLLELMWWCCSGQEMSCKLGGHVFVFLFFPHWWLLPLWHLIDIQSIMFDFLINNLARSIRCTSWYRWDETGFYIPFVQILKEGWINEKYSTSISAPTDGDSEETEEAAAANSTTRWWRPTIRR